MRHIKPYGDNSQSFGITRTLNYDDLIMNESAILSRIESLIPENVRFELEIKLLLEQGFRGVDNFNRNLLQGKNILLEQVSDMFSSIQMDEITTSYKSIVDELKSPRLNEDESIEKVDPSSADIITDPKKEASLLDANVLKNIESTTDVPKAKENAGGILGILKNLALSLTEGGEPIGIIHLILDIIGLVGDGIFVVTGVPVGLIADILNGVIYLIRGASERSDGKGGGDKFLLALVSFIAAAIPFGGDIMKAVFKGTKAGRGILEISTHYASPVVKRGSKYTLGTAKITPEAVNTIAKAGPETISGLDKIAKSASKAVPLVGNLLAKFFKGFLAKVTGWMPLIGKPLKKFFDSIGNMFETFEKGSARFAADVPKLIDMGHIKNMDDFFAAAGQRGRKIVTHGDELRVLNSKGVVMSSMPAVLLKSGGNVTARYGDNMAKFLQDAYGGTVGKKEVGNFVKQNKLNLADFYKGIALNTEHASKAYGVAHRIGTSVFRIKGYMPLFIGKQIIKFADSFGDKLLSDGEVKAIGLKSIQQTVQHAINKYLKDNPDASYVAPILGDRDKKSGKVLNDTLQKNATHFGLPDIGVVAHAWNNRKDSVPPEVEEFYNMAYGKEKIEIIRNMENRLQKGMGMDKTNSRVSESISLKHITPFSKFIR